MTVLQLYGQLKIMIEQKHAANALRFALPVCKHARAWVNKSFIILASMILKSAHFYDWNAKYQIQKNINF